MTMLKLIKGIGVILLVIYVLGCAFLYITQDDIIFRPTPLDEQTHYRWGQEVYIDVEEDVQLHGLYHQTPDAQGAILYLHGNRGNTRWCQRQAESFDSYDMDVLLIDYRGYGKSDGEIESLAQLETDMDHVYEWLKSRHPGQPMWVAGYSLGSGLASYLADKFESQSLILVAPYVSIEAMKDDIMPIIPDFLVKYPLDNMSHLENYQGSVAIFHGTEDEVIPYDHSEQLHARHADKVRLVTLQDVGHRRAIFHPSISTYLKELAKTR